MSSVGWLVCLFCCTHWPGNRHWYSPRRLCANIKQAVVWYASNDTWRCVVHPKYYFVVTSESPNSFSNFDFISTRHFKAKSPPPPASPPLSATFRFFSFFFCLFCFWTLIPAGQKGKHLTRPLPVWMWVTSRLLFSFLFLEPHHCRPFIQSLTSISNT